MTVDVGVQNRIGTQNDTKEPPKEPYGRLFLRFLRFGFLAWGGPVAQIAMIQRELVEEEGWLFGIAAVALEAVFLVAAVTLTPYGAEAAAQPVGTAASGTASISQLLFSGLRAGLLTFGGAYTVIPFLQRDAVMVGGWMTNAQFLNGVTAGVVGLIAATTVVLFQEGITSLPALIIFTLALLAIYLWKAKAAVAGIVLGAGLLGLLLFGG